MMKTIIALALVAALAACAPEVNDEVLADISALKKGGATHADCEDLAKTTCKEVEAEVTNNQRVLDSLKDGSQCLRLGQREVRKATIHFRKTMTSLKSAKVAVFKASKVKIHFLDRKFSDLKYGKCGWVFTSRQYLAAHRSFKRSVSMKLTWTGRTREAKRVLHLAIASARRQVKKCHCATKKVRDRLWKKMTNASTLARQRRAHQKCKMMSCVLSGTKLTEKKCQSRLKSLKHKRLISATERVRGCPKGLTRLVTHDHRRKTHRILKRI